MTTQNLFYGTALCDRCPSCGALPAHRVCQDARVYLAGYPGTEAVNPSAGTCVGVVWTAQPLAADAGPRSWGPAAPDADLERVLNLYRRAHADRTGQAPRRHCYFKVLHLSHVPCGENLGKANNSWACKYHEKVPDDPAILIAAWGNDHGRQATRHALRAIHAHLDATSWHRDEMLFYLQEEPVRTQVGDTSYSRPILPRPPEELASPLALDDPAFQTCLPELASSLRTSILACADPLDLEE